MGPVERRWRGVVGSVREGRGERGCERVKGCVRRVLKGLVRVRLGLERKEHSQSRTRA